MAKLAIVGTGFVGTSLALALRPSKLFEEIAAYDRDRARLQTATRLGAIDREARTAAEALDAAGVIVLAVPGDELEPALAAIAQSVAPGAVVSETTRWKMPAQKLAERLLPAGVHFVGGRPVLDNVGHGPEEASTDAFRNAIYCLTPGTSADDAAIDAMSAVATAAGAQPYFLDPAEHDALTAAGELLPSALVATLTRTIMAEQSWTDAGKLAGDGFSRLASLAEELAPGFWHEAAENSAALARWLDAAASSLIDLRDRLKPEAGEELANEWRTTTTAIARWRRQKRQLQESAMPPMSELRPNLFGNLGHLRGGGKTR